MSNLAACVRCGAQVPAAGKPWCCSAGCADTYALGTEGPSSLLVPRADHRKPITVYQCDTCGIRALGEQRCEDCTTFMRRVGIGGRCPCCEDLITAAELIGEGVIVGG